MEMIRRRMRSLLGSDSWPYRLASAVYGDAATAFSEGPRTFLTLRKLRRAAAGATPVPIKFRRLRHPLLIRPGTLDVESVLSNVIHEECGRFEPAQPPRTMIDAGAYVGDSTAYFLSRFPDLQVVALEPNPESYHMAEQNLAPYGERVILLPYALSVSETPVYISGKETGARISDSEGVKAEATTIPRLLERFPNGRINILKLDVEGAEEDIFLAHPESWLSKVDLLIVETHGPKITQTVLAALAHNGWRTVQYRTQHFCTHLA